MPGRARRVGDRHRGDPRRLVAPLVARRPAAARRPRRTTWRLGGSPRQQRALDRGAEHRHGPGVGGVLDEHRAREGARRDGSDAGQRRDSGRDSRLARAVAAQSQRPPAAGARACRSARRPGGRVRGQESPGHCRALRRRWRPGRRARSGSGRTRRGRSRCARSPRRPARRPGRAGRLRRPGRAADCAGDRITASRARPGSGALTTRTGGSGAQSEADESMADQLFSTSVSCSLAAGAKEQVTSIAVDVSVRRVLAARWQSERQPARRGPRLTAPLPGFAGHVPAARPAARQSIFIVLAPSEPPMHRQTPSVYEA